MLALLVCIVMLLFILLETFCYCFECSNQCDQSFHQNSSKVNLSESIAVTSLVTKAESFQNIDSDMMREEHTGVVGNTENLEVSPENSNETSLLMRLRKG